MCKIRNVAPDSKRHLRCQEIIFLQERQICRPPPMVWLRNCEGSDNEEVSYKEKWVWIIEKKDRNDWVHTWEQGEDALLSYIYLTRIKWSQKSKIAHILLCQRCLNNCQNIVYLFSGDLPLGHNTKQRNVFVEETRLFSFFFIPLSLLRSIVLCFQKNN